MDRSQRPDPATTPLPARDALLHELCNRAAPLLALAERLRELPLPEEYRGLLAALYRSSRDVERLLRSLRDPEDFLVPRPSEFDLGALAAQVCEGMAAAARAGGTRILLDLGAPVHVRADEVQVAEVIVNLLKNAVEAAGRGGRVVLSVAARGRVARVSVKDDGPGIAPALAGRLFSPGASTKGSQGRGIGLALSLAFARAQRGRLVHRRRGGETEFVLLLPRAPVAAPGASPVASPAATLAAPVASPAASPVAAPGASPVAAPAPAPRSADSKPAVLVVEDDPDVRLALQTLLADAFSVTAVADGPAALRAVAERPFAAVLSDQHLGGTLDGEALLAEIGRIRPELAGRTLLMTGDSRRARAASVVRKPFDRFSLRGALHATLAGRSLAQSIGKEAGR